MQVMYNGTIFGGEAFCKQVNNFSDVMLVTVDLRR